MQPQRRIQRINNDNTDKDKFFLIFTPSSVDIECCCCFSLRTGMKLLSLFFLLFGAFAFYSATKAASNVIMALCFVITGVFIVIAASLYLSTSSYYHRHAYIAYVLYEILVLFNAIEDICGIVMLYLRKIPLGTNTVLYLNYFPFVLLGFILLCIVTLWIEIYLLWLIYSYMIHLKHNRLKVVFGQEVIVDDFHNDLAEPLLSSNNQLA